MHSFFILHLLISTKTRQQHMVKLTLRKHTVQNTNHQRLNEFCLSHFIIIRLLYWFCRTSKRYIIYVFICKHFDGNRSVEIQDYIVSPICFYNKDGWHFTIDMNKSIFLVFRYVWESIVKTQMPQQWFQTKIWRWNIDTQQNKILYTNINLC